ncbi:MULTISPECIES: type II toxin-antitoxin system VapC family toxin [unclassified Microcystis]|jgi:predicted nucleic acid-binding protein|uniref:type II toxin-antitoxin system VapC family toxin n=1 Tax=unclassified Microcystis TaxID=2643300 RepID=UPI0011912B79|nr:MULTISPECIES: type II toxin-antitoxin system VapC family toxin [unclassified Microcystis]MCA2927259.1 type II toxin-antitoxin system VapC family toxin [Microcystis sp. M020S1]MCA2934450.1 type II toxin-antitoxin system VapC family toxin [Microcystis sp. M015S1]NCS49250.1 type II toxin-antitoxin system VapC family toxin [Microcystis aeruginosa BK11-02]MCA2618393.1 type II toxin-antitoxin system VapC family toxin [Microcystis sp. M099S2]MCA2649994.1 type II toxin-antitoxin system VapC family 
MAKYLLDTNILLRGSDPDSSSHLLAIKAVSNLLKSGHDCYITSQVLIEFWVVATRPIEVNGLGWSVKQTSDEVNQLINRFSWIEETSEIFFYWHNLANTYNIKGKRTHDIRLIAVMKTQKLTHLLTFNPDDFIKIPDIQIIHPNEIVNI